MRGEELLGGGARQRGEKCERMDRRAFGPAIAPAAHAQQRRIAVHLEARQRGTSPKSPRRVAPRARAAPDRRAAARAPRSAPRSPPRNRRRQVRPAPRHAPAIRWPCGRGSWRRARRSGRASCPVPTWRTLPGVRKNPYASGIRPNPDQSAKRTASARLTRVYTHRNPQHKKLMSIHTKRA